MKVRGVVVRAEASVRAPLSERTCVAVEARVRAVGGSGQNSGQDGGRGGGRDLVRETHACPFELEARDGRVFVVDPATTYRLMLTMRPRNSRADQTPEFEQILHALLRRHGLEPLADGEELGKRVDSWSALISVSEGVLAVGDRVTVWGEEEIRPHPSGTAEGYRDVPHARFLIGGGNEPLLISNSARKPRPGPRTPASRRTVLRRLRFRNPVDQ